MPRGGWSLLELVLALSVLTLAAAALAGLARLTTLSLHVTVRRLDAQQAARRGIERVADELRWAEAVLPEPSCGAAGLCADRVRVSIPAGNPYRRDQPYEVLFQHNARQRELERRVGRTVNNLTSWIDRMVVSYLDAGGRAAGAAAEVTHVRIALVVAPPDSRPTVVETLVGLRNRRAR
jgi:hypothetical protein